MTGDEYLQHCEHCLVAAEVAPTDHVRASLLRIAELCEIEARLIKHLTVRLVESRAAIAKVNALLGLADGSPPGGAASAVASYRGSAAKDVS